MAICNRVNDETYLKWFKRPSHPLSNWSFTEDGVEQIKISEENVEDFKIPTVNGSNEALREEEIWSTPKSISFTSFLKNVSENEAKFPDTLESKLISKTLDNIVMEITNILCKKGKVLENCSSVRVGSSAEGLKSGDPNEFDYNIILPNLSKYVILEHHLQNYALTDAINETFFPAVSSASGETEDDTIYYKIENIDVMNDILPDMTNMLDQEVTEFAKLIVLGNCLDSVNWKETAAPFAPSPQRSTMKELFRALKKIIEDILKELLNKEIEDSQDESLVPKLSMIPNNTLHEFQPSNQSALTTTPLWNGTEFKDLVINIDFAFLIPMKKQPQYYNLPKYLKLNEGLSYTPTICPLVDTEKTIHYVIRSYNTCRLSMAINETEILSTFPSNSVVKQSIRVCKKLRELFMTHYFDAGTETICPVLQSYWIKTVAMCVFSLHKKTDCLMKDNDDVHLGKYVFEIFRMLACCLTGDDGRTEPFLASFNMPFKNLFKSFGEVDEEIGESSPAYTEHLDDLERDILLRPHVVAANDIKILLNVLSFFDADSEAALAVMKEWKRCNNDAKSLIYKKGMREKLGMLLYLHFTPQEKPPTSDYKEFITSKFPNMRYIELEEAKEVEYCSMTTTVPIEIVEDEEPFDFEEMFTIACNKLNFLDVSNRRLVDEHFSKEWYE